jgi:hypothetical protein
LAPFQINAGRVELCLKHEGMSMLQPPQKQKQMEALGVRDAPAAPAWTSMASAWAEAISSSEV